MWGIHPYNSKPNGAAGEGRAILALWPHAETVSRIFRHLRSPSFALRAKPLQLVNASGASRSTAAIAGSVSITSPAATPAPSLSFFSRSKRHFSKAIAHPQRADLNHGSIFEMETGRTGADKHRSALRVLLDDSFHASSATAREPKADGRVARSSGN